MKPSRSAPAAPAPGYAPPPAAALWPARLSAAGGYVPPGSVPPGGQGAATPIYKNKSRSAVAAAVVLFLGYAYTQRTPSRPQPDPVSNGQGPVAGGPQGGGAPQGGPGPQGGGAPGGGQQGASGEYPTLASSGSGPALQVNRMQNGYAIPFLIQVDGTPTPAA